MTEDKDQGKRRDDDPPPPPPDTDARKNEGRPPKTR